ncbi:MAG: TolC family outer membrane protein [Gammaproteobacteria bacterium]
MLNFCSKPYPLSYRQFWRQFLISGIFVFPALLRAENLFDIYQMALKTDPGLKAKAAEHAANAELPIQTKAALLPQLNANTKLQNHNQSSPSYKKYKSENHSLNLSQSIFDYTAVQNHRAAQFKEKNSAKNWDDYNQRFALEVSNRYFQVLNAFANLHYTEKQAKAFQTSLNQSIAQNKAGVNTITDVHEAQAKYDNAHAEHIAALNQVEIKKTQLMEFLGSQTLQKIADLKPGFKPQAIVKYNLNHWLSLSKKNNAQLLAAHYGVETAKHNWFAKKADYLPNVSFNSSLSYGSNNSSQERRFRSNSIGLSISLPIFSSGHGSSRIQQSYQELNQTQFNQEQLIKSIDSQVKQSFFNLSSHESRVTALKQAIVSNRSALNATQSAFEAGTRTLLDVLNAQSSLLQSERDYKSAKYSYILEYLTLKYLAGSIRETDLVDISRHLI